MLLNVDWRHCLSYAHSRIQIAKNLPVSNTGSVTLTFRPAVGTPIVVPIKHSALLHPGEYQVTAQHLGIPTPPILITRISYDPVLHHFNVKIVGDANEAQFSVLVNLADVGPPS